MATGRRWVVCDRYDNEIYLTDERWKHIIEPTNHPEMSAYEEHLKETIQSGKRKQDPLNPPKYHYFKSFDDLIEDNTVSSQYFGEKTPPRRGLEQVSPSY